jgi:hypothetical protein
MPDPLENVKREAMIEMLEALDNALGVRVQKWADEAHSIPRVCVNPRQGNKNKDRVLECKIRIDEIKQIRELVTATARTCREQNEGVGLPQ